MSKIRVFPVVTGFSLLLILSVGFAAGTAPAAAADGVSTVVRAPETAYEALLSLFRDFREFQRPVLREGVPDYTAAAMSAQKSRIPEFRERLRAIDPLSWPIPRRVDWAIVQAEINGLEFDHRVLRPWARDPSFYAAINPSEPDVPDREGPEIFRALCLAYFEFPLQGEQRVDFQAKLEAVPGMLAQARINLNEAAKQLWFFGIRQKKGEIAAFDALARRFADMHPDLVPAVERARDAVTDFLAWLEKGYAAMPETADGIGVENFDWYMKNVHLVPFTWKEQMEICRRELERSWTSLRLEEHRNRDLPLLEPAASLEELRTRLKKAVEDFMGFLREREIFTVPDYMHLDSEVGSYAPPERRGFFTRVEYHHYLPLRCHMVHWLEKQREKLNTHPIRGVPLLYNIWDSRAEGLATGFEETLLQAGLMDEVPRARELTYILLAFRAARAMGDLRLHSREWTLEQAVDFAVRNTPRGWVKPDGSTIWGDIGLYLRQPGYGTSYVYGKIQFDRLLADMALQLGSKFKLRDVLDDYFSRGVIPASLLRWEMTGLHSDKINMQK